MRKWIKGNGFWRNIRWLLFGVITVKAGDQFIVAMGPKLRAELKKGNTIQTLKVFRC